MTQQAALFHTTDELPTWARHLPVWLAHNLDDHQPPPRSGLAKLRPCDRCKHVILTGHDSVTTWHADTTRLDPNQEVAAAILTRPTIHLNRTHLGIEGHRRFEWDITAHPARTHLVVPSHVCHRPLGTPIPWESLYTRPQEFTDANENPPF
jgi:hypothetical protein